MAANGLECIRSSSLLTVDQLPASSHACIVPSPIANSLSVASAGLDGQIRLVQFEDGPAASTEASMDQTSAIINKASNQPLDMLIIGKDSYPVLSVTSVTRDPYTVIAYGGLGRHIHLAIRTPHSYPQFLPLITLDASSPINTMVLQTLSYNKREEVAWNLRLYAGSQDKTVHLHSVSVSIEADGTTIKAVLFHHLVFIGHTSYVRAIAFNHSATGEPISMLTGSDDFTFKVWPLNLLETAKVERCTTYEGHENDIIAIDCQSGWVITGSKDKSVGFWDLNPAKNARAEKVREVSIIRVPVGVIVRSVLLSEDATMALAGCGDGTVKVLKRTLSEWALVASKQLHNAPIDTLLLTQNVVVSSSQDVERSIAVWTLPTLS